MRRFFQIVAACAKTSISRSFAYRADFLLSALIALAGSLGVPLFSLLIYGAGAGFPGWSFYEVLLLQGVFTVSSGVSGMLFSNVFWATMTHIREGTFETVLLKPVHPLFYLTASTFALPNASLILGGAALMGVGLSHTEGAGPFAWGQFLLLFLAGTAVMAGISFIMAATSFKWVGNSRIPEIFDSVKDFGKYPMGIFPGAVQGVASFIIPVGMIGFFPASALLSRAEASALFAVMPCLLFFSFGVWLYRHMIRLYEGVGG